MRKVFINSIRCFAALFSIVLVSILLTGCPSGGGGGGTTTTPPVTNPIHTQFTPTKAFVYELGKSYTVSITVQETRGDDVNINKLRTYRTLTMNGDYNTEQSANYYYAGASLVYGYMLVPNSTTYVENLSSLGSVNQHILKGYESRTIRTAVMVGRQYENKPAGFNGIYISFNEFKSWVDAGKTGIKYWIVMEGYDYKLNDSYNIFMPLEILFNTQLANPNTGTNTGTGTGTGTNPYDPGTNPF